MLVIFFFFFFFWGGVYVQAFSRYKVIDNEKNLRWSRRDYINTHLRRGVFVCCEMSHTHTHLQTQKYKYTNIERYKKYTNIQKKYKNTKTQTLHLRGNKLLNCLTPPPCPPTTPAHPAPSVKGLTFIFRYSVMCVLMLGINDHEHVTQAYFKRILVEIYNASDCAVVFLFSAVGCEQE